MESILEREVKLREAPNILCFCKNRISSGVFEVVIFKNNDESVWNIFIKSPIEEKYNPFRVKQF